MTAAEPRILLLCLLLTCLGCSAAAFAGVSAVNRPDAAARNAHYVSNRDPLLPSALIKLPVGAIRPQGWLRKQLRLQADGFHGHLGDISSFLKKENNSWLSPTGEGDHGWEEVPYWLKGFLNAAYVLNDPEMIAEARLWIEGALNSRQQDGWFGPDKDRSGAWTQLKGRDDLWPNAIMLFCLQDYHEATNDPRVIHHMTDYFRYLHQVPEEKYLLGYWPKMRGGDLLYSIYWLYNRTGEPWLLELAAKNHRQTARWDEDVINWHNVNLAQAFGEPATWYLQSKNDSDLQAAYRNWTKARDLYGQFPGGMFAGDENCRKGYDDPHNAIETCGIVEEMLSDETLVAITGDITWADRCEDAAYNSLTAALTADLKALRYLTAANMVTSDRTSHKPGLNNGGPMFYMNPHGHRCCQHNFGHGWPYLAQHLWYATPDNGLAAVFYNASTVTATVASSTQLTIAQKTNYPFDGDLRFEFDLDQPAEFPLYFRVPGWCESFSLKINGQPADVAARPLQYLRIARTWNAGDTVELDFAMPVRTRTWTANHNAVSVDRGPLTFSLLIQEDYRREGGTDQWPAWEILPATPWNYALVLDPDPADSFELVTRPWPASDMPWTHEGAPILLKATGKRIPNWTLDEHALCGQLHDSPIKTDQPAETITLIPMGAARLRISAFPTASDAPNAKPWPQQPAPAPAPDAENAT